MSHYVRMAGFSIPQQRYAGGSALVGGQFVGLADRHFNGSGLRACDHGFVDVRSASWDALRCARGDGPAALAIRFEGDLDNTYPVVTGSRQLPSDCLGHGVSQQAASDVDAATAYTPIEVRFFIDHGAASDTPELYCVGNGGALWMRQPLVSGVESLRLRFVLAPDELGSQPQRDFSAEQVDALGGSIDQNWRRVVAVELCFVMRSDQAVAISTGYFDCGGRRQSTDDRWARRAFHSFVALRNRLAPL